MKRQAWLWLGLAWIFFGLNVVSVNAAPYFYITGETSTAYLNTYIFSVYLYTDGQTLTAVQGVFDFNESIYSKEFYGSLGTRCSFFAPPDPSLGMGTTVTPLFYGEDKFVVACGFANPGHTSSSGLGDLIAKFAIKQTNPISATSQITLVNSMFKYIANPVMGGSFTAINLSSTAASIAATPTVAATPTPVSDVLSLDQLQFLGSSGTSSGRTTGANQTSSLQNQISIGPNPTSFFDNRIPTPPVMTPRPSSTPAPDISESLESKKEGDVLSIQSLRELLLPGKSNADRTVVLINLISALAFLVVLTILVWRLIIISRTNKIKQRHMKDLLTGEISVLETKVAAGSDREDLADKLEELKARLEKE